MDILTTFFMNKSVIILLFIGIIIFSGWFLIRDIIAGIILRTEENIKVGDLIRFDEFTGRVQKAGIRCLHLKKDEDTQVIIPYSNITPKIISKILPSKTTDPYTFTLDVKKKIDLSAHKEKIRQAVLCTIWISLERSPYINLIKEQNSVLTFQVTVYPLLPEYGMKIENILKTS